MSVFVIKGVPVVKLVSPTVYGQASQPDHAFNNASGHFEKKIIVGLGSQTDPA